MKRETLFLKAIVLLMGISVLAPAVFWLPRLAVDMAEMYPEFAYLRYPILIGLYITVIPYFIALQQTFKLLIHIDGNNAFTEFSVNALNNIRHCAVAISISYIVGVVFLFSQNALHPGVAIIGFTIILASAAIAVFAAVLQKLLKNAIDIKTENDLTV